MNAPGAHYVANAGAKIQLFSGTAIAFAHFFASGHALCRPKQPIHQLIIIKSWEMAIFLLFLCNFAVALRLLTDRRATAPDINKRKQQDICRTFETSQSLRT